MTEALDKYILYADDDADDQQILTDMVHEISSDIDLVTVDGGEQLIDYLDHLDAGKNYPCLILVDMNMPKMDGIETLKKLKASRTYSKVPVIMFSTSDNLLSVTMAKLLGAADYIKKPIDTHNLRFIANRFAQQCEVVPDVKK